MSFFSSVDKDLEKYYHANLVNSSPEPNIAKLRLEIQEHVNFKRTDKLKELMALFKKLFKDKLPAHSKFFALLLLSQIMESKIPKLVEYFIKKLLSRLYLIASFEISNNDINRGSRCLNKYYNNQSPENQNYSLKFFVLLLECWKRWDSLYSQSYKRIREKCDKLRHIFTANDLYINYFDPPKQAQEPVKREHTKPTKPKSKQDSGSDKEPELYIKETKDKNKELEESTQFVNVAFNEAQIFKGSLRYDLESASNGDDF